MEGELSIKKAEINELKAKVKNIIPGLINLS
jgi:hypothetical protein